MSTAVGRFEPPGPGSWELETAHFVRPATRFLAELFPGPFTAGFADGARRYGLLLAWLELRFVHGFGYVQIRPAGAPPGAIGRPPKLVLQVLMHLHPAIRERTRASEAAFSEKLWRRDLQRWDEVDRPDVVRRHRALAAVDPDALAPAALWDHLETCRAHLWRMLRLHHYYNFPALVAVGDFLAHAVDLTGMEAERLLRLLRGTSAVSVGDCPERRRLARALRADPAARALLSDGEPAAVLRALARQPGEVGEAARAYVGVIGHRLIQGFDVSELTALEQPALLLGGLREALSEERAGGSAPEELLRTARQEVPAAHRALFDELLGEARLVHRLRDERALYTDAPALGLMRRALLAAGKRASDAGRAGAPADFLEASWGEMRSLLDGGPAPPGEELVARRRLRMSLSIRDAPAVLGPPPAEPPPVDWLPRRARRMARAIDIAMKGVMRAPPARTEIRRVRGLAVSPGVHEGPARLVRGAEDLCRIQQGDVLVTGSTSAAFNIVLPLLGALVTDRGGMLSHAAIVAREYGIPAVIGTSDATRLIPDGARVRVDGTNGAVEVLP